MEHIYHICDKLKEIKKYMDENNIDESLLADFELKKYQDFDVKTKYLKHEKKHPSNIYYISQDVGNDIIDYYIDSNDISDKSILCLVGILNFHKDTILQIICDKLRKPMSAITFKTVSQSIFQKCGELDEYAIPEHKYSLKRDWVINDNIIIVQIDNWNCGCDEYEYTEGPYSNILYKESIYINLKIVVDTDIKYYLIDDKDNDIEFSLEALDEMIKSVL